MKTAYLLVFILGILSRYTAFAQVPSDGLSPAEGMNIGNPAIKGTFVYESRDQQYLLTGAGYNIWNTRDEFFFLARKTGGDLIFSAVLEFKGAGTELHRKAGIMFRSSLEEDAPYVDVAVHGDGLTSLQYRSAKGGVTHEIAAEIRNPQFIQLERTGNRFVMRLSKDNSPLVVAAELELALPDEVHAGLFVCSHNAGVTETALFRNVRLDVPATVKGGNQAPPSPSRLETLDIVTGARSIVHTSTSHFEAPNWSRNGKFLIYNQEGLLYRFDLKPGKIRQINTGFANANNNDHGISFDGKMLAISHHTIVNEKRQSIIYTVPVKGGTPARITETGPSYWHGWSPDDLWLTYCAERNGNYDVYKIPAAGGEEIRLTSTEGLDDGPEYSPCGNYIYFNSVRSGTMQIWRMKPDGSLQEQVTFDAYNDWFPHPSPDGKWLIFVSYLPEVPAASHPRNERVMLRLMNLENGEIRALAFLYGGQGTINVPSWSPDSRKVAFVSYTY